MSKAKFQLPNFLKNKYLILFWIFIIAGLWFFITKVAELKDLSLAFGEIDTPWIIIVISIQVIYYFFYSEIWRYSLLTTDIKISFREMLKLVVSAQFVNVATPLGGTGGAALIIDDATRRKFSPARATAGSLLAYVADFSSLLVLLIMGMIFLFRRDALRGIEVFAASIMFALLFGIIILFFLGIKKHHYLGKILHFVEKLLNSLRKIFKRVNLPEGWSNQHSKEFYEASDAIRKYPSRLTKAFIFSFIARFIEIFNLFLMFKAIHQPITFQVLLAGYVIAILFWVISITPQGIGIVEGAMALTYISLGVPPAQATLIALIFRGVVFWVPLLVGFITFRHLKIFKNEDSQKKE